MTAEVWGEGWFDFIKDCQTHEVFYFWLYLSCKDADIKVDCAIPLHIWDKLSSKAQGLLKDRSYDSEKIESYESQF